MLGQRSIWKGFFGRNNSSHHGIGKIRSVLVSKTNLSQNHLSPSELTEFAVLFTGPRDEWIKLGQKSKPTKKESVISGDLHIVMELKLFSRVHAEKNEAAKLLSKLFQHEYTPSDILAGKIFFRQS
jgi:hypothetical protein